MSDEACPHLSREGLAHLTKYSLLSLKLPQILPPPSVFRAPSKVVEIGNLPAVFEYECYVSNVSFKNIFNPLLAELAQGIFFKRKVNYHAI